MGSFLYAFTHSLTTFNKLLLSKARTLLPDLPGSSYYSLLMFYLFLFLTIFNLISLKKPPNYFLNIPFFLWVFFSLIKEKNFHSGIVVSFFVFCFSSQARVGEFNHQRILFSMYASSS